MPLQNRVDPFGEIHAVSERGLFTGNRGVIHDPATKTLLKRRWSTKAWIICVCAFRGRRRPVMGRNAPSGKAGWTELFFLDEVTALAAGHRPCFYCQRDRAMAFATAYGRATGTPRQSATVIDARLHAERNASGGERRPLTARDIADLPDGTMICDGKAAFAKRAGGLLPWSFSGYGAALPLAAGHANYRLLTPSATMGAVGAGYQPCWHPSAD